MTQKEKARAYDEAVEKLRNVFYDNNSRMCEEYRNAVLKIIEPIFPELSESEDERIRKELISFIRGLLACHDKPNAERDEKYESWIAWLEKQSKGSSVLSNFSNTGKSSWSEEDKEIVEALNYYVKNLDILFSEIKIGNKDILSKEFREKVQHWLKSLKNRVQPQSQQEWGKEDKKFIERSINNLTELEQRYGEEYGMVGKCINWLKSFRPQLQWRPSDEQMTYIQDAISKYNEFSNEYTGLVKLYNDLKKLREE